MKVRLRAAVILAALAITTVSCGSDKASTADIAACKSAMRQQLQDSIDAGETATPGTRPAACDGIDAKTLETLVGDLMTEELDDAVESALPDPEPSGTAAADGITPDCRAWIEAELTDNSSTLDATSGEQACGYMTEDELNAAIDSITEELSTADPAANRDRLNDCLADPNCTEFPVP
jgi:hypothetical protein